MLNWWLPGCNVITHLIIERTLKVKRHVFHRIVQSQIKMRIETRSYLNNYFYSNFKINFWKQTVEYLIRRRVLLCLIWFCSVCWCPTKGSLGLCGLTDVGKVFHSLGTENVNEPLTHIHVYLMLHIVIMYTLIFDLEMPSLISYILSLCTY